MQVIYIYINIILWRFHPSFCGPFDVCHAKEDAEAKDGETKDGETKDGEAKDGEAKDGEAKDGEAKDGETKDGETKDAETKDGEAKAEKAANNRTMSSKEKVQKALKDAEAAAAEMQAAIKSVGGPGWEGHFQKVCFVALDTFISIYLILSNR